MANKRRSFERPSPSRQIRRLFLLSVEGRITEWAYFEWLNRLLPEITIRILKRGNRSGPRDVLERMLRQLEDGPLREGDEAWLVIDQDRWEEAQIQQLYAWTKLDDAHHLALSNPRFEYWLLLHFEDGVRIRGEADFKRRFDGYLSDYDKHLDMRHFTRDMLHEAIARAKKRDTLPNDDWPRTPYQTTVYRLVLSMITASDHP